MTNAQRVLLNFKQEFGNLPYREIANMTGIQMTRVFRIFNQQEMKVSEYEKFKELLLQKKTGISRLQELFDQNAHFLRPSFVGKLARVMEREIKISGLVQPGGK